MAKAQLLLLFPALFIDMGLGEVITLSELWTAAPCNKEIVMSEAKKDIELRASSVYITQVLCKDRNNASLVLASRIIKTDIYYRITNPMPGSWNCSFRSQLHARASNCMIHLKNVDDITSDKQLKVREILAWTCLLVVVSIAAVVALGIIAYYKMKVKRIEINEIPDHVRQRAPLELPSELTYDSVYSHRIHWSLKRHSAEEKLKCDNKPNIQPIMKLDDNSSRAGYIPHNNLFV